MAGRSADPEQKTPPGSLNAAETLPSQTTRQTALVGEQAGMQAAMNSPMSTAKLEEKLESAGASPFLLSPGSNQGSPGQLATSVLRAPSTPDAAAAAHSGDEKAQALPSNGGLRTAGLLNVPMWFTLTPGSGRSPPFELRLVLEPDATGGPGGLASSSDLLRAIKEATDMCLSQFTLCTVLLKYQQPAEFPPRSRVTWPLDAL